MVAYLLNGAFLIFITAESLKQKKYRYTAAAVIATMYFIFAIMQNNYNLVANAQVLGWIQKGILVLFAGCMAFVLVRSANRKMDVLAFLFSCVACACRFLRSFAFQLYNENIQIPGADVLAVHQEYLTYYALADALTNFALIVVLFCVAWQLGKSKATDS